MTIRKLEIYYAVAKKLNMTQVAKELYISQPSISQVIKELEEEMEVKLFKRIGKKLYLTDEGKVFQKYSLRIINLYKESKDVIDEMRNLKRGRIKIGASTTIGTYLLPDIIASFKKKYPDIEVELIIANTKIIAETLLNNRVDIGFIEGEVKEEELRSVDFLEDELIIISSPKKNFEDRIKVKKLEEETFIQREEGSGSRRTYEGFLGIRNRNTFVFGSTETIKKAVIKELGIACVSRLAVEEEKKRGELSISKIEGVNINRNFKCLYHKDKEFSRILDKFLKFAKSKI